MQPITRATIHLFCRICLQEFKTLEKKNAPIQDVDMESDLLKWLDETVNFATIKSFPRQLCQTCLTAAQDCYEFQEKAFRSRNELMELCREKLEVDELRNLKRFCRICLKRIKHKSGSKNVYDEDVGLAIYKCFGKQMQLEKTPEIELAGFPKHICKNCYNKLFNLKEYKQMARQSLEYVDSILSWSDEKHNKVQHFPSVLSVRLSEPNSNVIEISDREKMNGWHSEDLSDEECILNDDICNDDFNELKAIEDISHITYAKSTREHKRNNKKTLKCDRCQKQFYKEIIYHAHQRKHNGVKQPFLCDQCPKTYALYHCLRRHTEKDHARKQKVTNCDKREDTLDKHKCKICFRQFKRRDHLMDHTRAVHDGVRPYTCFYCEKSFAAIKTRRIHEMTHTNEKPYSCEYCGRRFRQKTYLKNHIEIHTTNPELICPICKRAQSCIDELELHVQHHKEKAKHQCSKCGKIFSKLCHLKDHDKAVHLKIREFQCTFCNMSFAQKRSARNHERIHIEGEQTEVCNFCGATFSKVYLLRIHLKKQHNVELRS